MVVRYFILKAKRLVGGKDSILDPWPSVVDHFPGLHETSSHITGRRVQPTCFIVKQVLLTLQGHERSVPKMVRYGS